MFFTFRHPWLLGQEDNKKQYEFVVWTAPQMAPFTTYVFEKAQSGWTAGAGGWKINIVECYTVYLPLVRGLHSLVG